MLVQVLDLFYCIYERGWRVRPNLVDMRDLWILLTTFVLFVAVSAKQDDTKNSGVTISEDDGDSAGEEAMKVYMESQQPSKGTPRVAQSVESKEETEDSQGKDVEIRDTLKQPVNRKEKGELPATNKDNQTQRKSLPRELGNQLGEVVVPQLEAKPELDEEALAPTNRTAATARKGFRGRGFGGRGFGGRGFGWGFGGFGRPFGFGAPFGGFFPGPFIIG